MPRTTPDLCCASLVHGYLSSAASITAGVPDASTLPKTRMDAGGAATVPNLVTTASERGGGTAHRRTVEVVLFLHALLRNTESDAPADANTLARTQSRDTLAGYMDTIERRLRDRDAFNTYLATLDSDDLDGFAILSMRVQAQQEIKRDEKAPMNALTLAIVIEFALAWAA